MSTSSREREREYVVGVSLISIGVHDFFCYMCCNESGRNKSIISVLSLYLLN